ncbi:hypothetical protein B842_09215 [Corynebacterium humireducens NBRC 106098 = DSM 45392]|uniref:Major capsid protein n=1 Tax=Corynebacterium humireducens NBRC 106098 = DSM 45392 TaxID=1223515 RepID=A0A0B5D9M0_9CORY|nr:major capsid protein [Corynebacterium humireducens]AJE33692.1 hypothetical protein B842_09215 [Corynebacterium humireducens NBRC 106098 = DSM 45392]
MSFYPGRADYNNGVISVDQALNDPTIIEQRVAEIAGKNLIVDSVFAEGGEVTGGTVIYSKITEKHLFTENDVANRQPGDEYPVLYTARPEAQLARVQDFGGKFAVSDEARKRNNSIDFDNDTTRLANTIARKINRVAISTLDAVINAGENVQLVIDTPWHETLVDGATPTPPMDRPHYHIAGVFALAENLELGIEYKRLLVNPMTRANLRGIYGTGLKAMLDDYGLEMISSPYVASDKAFLVDPNNAGFVRYEEGLTVSTWRDEQHRQDWVQGYAVPVMGVTLPAAVATIHGIDA